MHRNSASIIMPYYRFSAPQLPGCPLKSRMHNLDNCHMPTTKSCTFAGGRDATVALPAWIVLAPYRILEASWAFVGICSSTVVNRSAAVTSRSVDESCRHRRSIVRQHRTDAGISFFLSRRIPMQPDFTICLKSGWVEVNRGLNRDSVHCNCGLTVNVLNESRVILGSW